MYYYEFYIDGHRKLYQSKYLFVDKELRGIIENFEMEYIQSNKYEKYVPPHEILNYLARHCGIIPMISPRDIQCSIHLCNKKDEFD